MNITLLYFAGLKELRARTQERLTLPEGNPWTVDGLRMHMEASYPELAGRLEGVRFAVNEAFVSSDAPIQNGDVVALIPPVSGG